MMRRQHHAYATVAELMVNDIENVEAACLRCGEAWLAPTDFLPPATTIAKIADLMVCPTCGGREVRIDLAPCH
jgi:Zn finger protein HypA/HybF involved in hydrogenase expression